MVIGYKKLKVWQYADELAYCIYTITKLFPKDELFSLTSQLRRAGLSVPTNIVEGYSRNSKAEFRRFVSIALGSLAEVRYLVEFSFKLKYLSTEEYQKTMLLIEECGQLLWKFYKSFTT